MSLNTPNRDRWSQHHYLFVHQVLLNLSRRLGSGIFAHLRSAPARELTSKLKELLRSADALVQDNSVRPFEAEDIKVSHHLFGSTPCVLVSMPPPERTGEAYFVAVVSRDQEAETSAREAGSSRRILPHPAAAEGPVNFYTLERASNHGGENSTKFCEWDLGCHCNYGKGPVPDKETFLAFLQDFALARALEEGRASRANTLAAQAAQKLESSSTFCLFLSIKQIQSE